MDNMLFDEDDTVIRRKVISPRVPSRSNAATRSHEASYNGEESLVMFSTI